MLSQKHRLSKSADVKKTTARGRNFFNPYFVIKSTTEPNAKISKITVIVSTKVSKKAVDRNRLKRIIREELRKSVENIKPGNYAILVKAQALKIEPNELRTAINKSFHDAKLLINK